MSAPKPSQTSAIRELLPWYATGALGREEAKSVEKALVDDAELARELELVREEMVETIHRNEMLGVPSARGLQRLMASIESEPRRAKTSVGNPIHRLAELISGFSARNVSWAAAAAAVVLIVQAGVITELVSTDRGTDSVVSTRGIDPASGSYVRIRFNGGATASDISRFLEANRLTIVAGPTGELTYQVKVADSQLSKDQLDQRIRNLRQAPVVGAVIPIN